MSEANPMVPMKQLCSHSFVLGLEAMRRLTAKSSPKRKDPIIQPINDYTEKPFKSSVTHSPLKGMTSFHKESSDEIFQSKGKGVYNAIDYPTAPVQWKPSVRQARDEVKRREPGQRTEEPKGIKVVGSPTKNPDPVLIGDSKPTYSMKRSRSAGFSKITSCSLYESEIKNQLKSQKERVEFEKRYPTYNFLESSVTCPKTPAHASTVALSSIEASQTRAVQKNLPRSGIAMKHLILHEEAPKRSKGGPVAEKITRTDAPKAFEAHPFAIKRKASYILLHYFV
jgi:hypothetical protein